MARAGGVATGRMPHPGRFRRPGSGWSANGSIMVSTVSCWVQAPTSRSKGQIRMLASRHSWSRSWPVPETIEMLGNCSGRLQTDAPCPPSRAHKNVACNILASTPPSCANSPSSSTPMVPLIRALLPAACHRVNPGFGTTLIQDSCRTIRKRYRTILTQGGKEWPTIPLHPKVWGGRIAKSDAHNLHEHPVRTRSPRCTSWPTQTSVLPTTLPAPISVWSQGRTIWMTKVKIKVFDCFRTRTHTEA